MQEFKEKKTSRKKEEYDSLYETLKTKIINFYNKHYCGDFRHKEARKEVHLYLLAENYENDLLLGENSEERKLSFLVSIENKVEKLCSSCWG